MSEYIAIPNQNIIIGSPILFNASIPCQRGYVFHEDGTGIFTLRGIVNNPCAMFTRYRVKFVGNIAVPTGETVGSIAVSLMVSGEEKTSSKAISSPTAVDQYNNITSEGIVTVPRGSGFIVSIDAVNALATSAIASINLLNGLVSIDRIA